MTEPDLELGEPTPAMYGREIFKPMYEGCEQPVRADVLDEARRLTLGDRNNTYGEPHDNLSRAAALLNAYFGTEFTAADVSILNGLLKLGRLPASPLHKDHYVDMANYFGGMAYECAKIDEERKGGCSE